MRLFGQFVSGQVVTLPMSRRSSLVKVSGLVVKLCGAVVQTL
jgi:hypothetical protein